jgi:hypothetical protein
MGRVSTVVQHLRVEEIDARIKACTAAWRIRRWQVIRCAFVHPKPAAEIALEVGLARQTVHNLIAAYNRRGPAAVETPGHGQRQRAYLSLGQEQRLVTRFVQQSAKRASQHGRPVSACSGEGHWATGPQDDGVPHAQAPSLA